ncbi:MAG: DUF1835 domain-containing protein [Bacteroidetes bacterium MedPE-SWsnd-G2]|nr:MAG: DUF1835 domain-containing protein [Bacteroidetes bacterium MedPE-SWsnd-G2]
MVAKTLHITNGENLSNYFGELNIEGDVFTWQEMLCEGPTLELLETEEFLKTRKDFLNSSYQADIDRYELEQEFQLLQDWQNYTEIILWFEYDLFCHINLVAIISLLVQKKVDLPLYLVCSGRIEHESQLKGLSELSPALLYKHYNNKKRLLASDIDLAHTIWAIYCGCDHSLLKPFITTPSSFDYLSNCLKAHLERFPDSKSGLSRLEENILQIIRDNKINSKHHLLGYALNYQGYYGFGDLQLERIINLLSIFYDTTEEAITLNRKGHEALLGQANFAVELNNDMSYGGVKRLNFQFSRKENKLIKTNINAY